MAALHQPRPPAPSGPTKSSERHLSVDALRGFALLGILVVNIKHMSEPFEQGWDPYTGEFDKVVRGFVHVFATFKIFPIFAMLFGYGFQLQLSRASNDLRPRYRRRMVGVIVLGALHAVFFFLGDILVLYGLVGLGAYAVRDWPTEKLLRVAAWIYGITTVFWLVIGALDGKKDDSSTTDSFVEAVTEGSFLDVMLAQAVLWIPVMLFLFVFQGPVVIASYMIGMAIGRTDWLSNPEAHRNLSGKALRWWPVGLAIAAFSAWLSLGPTKLDTLGFGVLLISTPLVAAGWVAIIVRLPANMQRLLQPSGRMSLTSYLLESVVAGVLFSAYGFGLIADFSPLGALGLGVAIWAGLSVFSHVWMRLFRFGPFEWLLRSYSYAKKQPLRRCRQRTETISATNRSYENPKSV